MTTFDKKKKCELKNPIIWQLLFKIENLKFIFVIYRITNTPNFRTMNAIHLVVSRLHTQTHKHSLLLI